MTWFVTQVLLHFESENNKPRTGQPKAMMNTTKNMGACHSHCNTCECKTNHSGQTTHSSIHGDDDCCVALSPSTWRSKSSRDDEDSCVDLETSPSSPCRLCRPHTTYDAMRERALSNHPRSCPIVIPVVLHSNASSSAVGYGLCWWWSSHHLSSGGAMRALEVVVVAVGLSLG